MAAVILGAVGLTSLLPIQIALTRQQVPQPQAVLVLEGNSDRITFAAQFAQQHPGLPIWISGNPKGLERNRRIFRQAQIPMQQVHFDFCAIDTVTNFTCNVEPFTAQQIRHVYLITSDNHMRRSPSIAILVFGSRGIVVTPVAVSSEGQPSEHLLETVRDCIRSLIWLLTGWSSANLKRFFGDIWMSSQVSWDEASGTDRDRVNPEDAEYRRGRVAADRFWPQPVSVDKPSSGFASVWRSSAAT